MDCSTFKPLTQSAEIGSLRKEPFVSDNVAILSHDLLDAKPRGGTDLERGYGDVRP